MKPHMFWPLAACLGLGGVIVAIAQVGAQGERPGGRPPGPGGPPGMPGGPGGGPGRFAVAHALPTQVLVLDTTTGQVYLVKAGDFKKASDIPATLDREGPPPPRRPGGGAREDDDRPPPPDRPRGEGDEKEKGRDKGRPKPPRADDD